MHKIATLFLFFMLALGLGSCALAELDEPIVVSQVEKEFQISMWEDLNPDRRSFKLQVQTLEPAPCLNTVIATQARKVGQSLRLSLLAIAEPEQCNPGTEPAFAEADYGQLEPGFYNVSVDLKETVENQGRLLVFKDRYELRMNTSKGIEIESNVLRRVPDATLWGYFAYDRESEAPLRDTLLSAVEPFAEHLNLPAGEYGYFSVSDKSRDLVLPEEPEANFVEPLLFRFAGDDLAALEKAVLSVREELPESVSLELRTWRGEVW